jgi:hypothetical protein
MGVLAMFLAGLGVATVQILAVRVERAERLRIFTLAALAAFFGGSLAKAIAAESVWTVSLGSLAGAVCLSGLVVYAWSQLGLRRQAARH